MLGKWSWNLGFGIFGFILIFLLSLSNNPLITSLLRGTYAFITFFLIAYPVRFVFSAIMPRQLEEDSMEAVEPPTGTQVNLVTPDDEQDLNEVLRAQISESKESTSKEQQGNVEQLDQFQPLRPTQLVSTDKMQTEDLTKAIRHLTGE